MTTPPDIPPPDRRLLLAIGLALLIAIALLLAWAIAIGATT